MMNGKEASPALPSLIKHVGRLILFLYCESTLIALLLLADQIIDYETMPPGEPLTNYACNPSFYFIIISTLCLLAGLYVGVAARKKILEPLTRLSLSIEALREGNLQQAIEAGSGFYEIEEIAAVLNKMVKTNEEKNLMRQKLLSGLAHELFTPLTALRGNLEAIQEGVFKADEKIEVLLDATLRMQHLIRDFRDLSMAEAGVLSLKKVDSSLASLVAQALQIMEPLFEEKGITVATEGAPLPACALDQERFSQIMQNLLTAILTYTDAGGKITITLTKIMKDQQQWHCISLEDSGPEIEEEQLPYVFEHFYGPEKARSTGAGKNHIAFALAKSLTKVHGGRAEVTVTHGKGNIFAFYFPS
jgi:two-component system, OmpR family, sensor histidine kinase BaeS